MTENEMKIIAKQIDRIISNIDNEVIYKQVKKEVVELSDSFPLYQN